jgi:hypothetical protein
MRAGTARIMQLHFLVESAGQSRRASAEESPGSIGQGAR